MNITKEELKQIDIYDYVVINDDLEKAIEKVKNIIESEKSKVNRNYIDIDRQGNLSFYIKKIYMCKKSINKNC